MSELNEVLFKIESTKNLALTDVIMYFEAINFGFVKTNQKLIKSNKSEKDLQPIVESISEGSILLKLLVPLVKEINKELLVSRIAEILEKKEKI